MVLSTRKGVWAFHDLTVRVHLNDPLRLRVQSEPRLSRNVSLDIIVLSSEEMETIGRHDYNQDSIFICLSVRYSQQNNWNALRPTSVTIADFQKDAVDIRGKQSRWCIFLSYSVHPLRLLSFAERISSEAILDRQDYCKRLFNIPLAALRHLNPNQGGGGGMRRRKEDMKRREAKKSTVSAEGLSLSSRRSSCKVKVLDSFWKCIF